MAPQVLYNVIHGSANPEPWQKAMLSFQPAILHGYRRHRVRGADYPGIVPVARMEESTEASSNAINARNSVIGTLVSGLTDGDLYRLDIFEGPEYAKTEVVVRELRKSHECLEDSNQGESPLHDMLDGAARGEIADEGEEVSAKTYVWISGEDRLEVAEWDFEAFQRDKLKWWAAATEDEW